MGHTLGRCRGGGVSYTDQVTDPGKGSVIGMGTKGCCSRKGGHRKGHRGCCWGCSTSWCNDYAIVVGAAAVVVTAAAVVVAAVVPVVVVAAMVAVVAVAAAGPELGSAD